MKRKVTLEDGRKITLLGTAHVSDQSIDEVKEAIDEKEPDRVFVELDEGRLQSLKKESGWKDKDLLEIISSGQINLLAFTLLLSIYQRKIGEEFGVNPGTELLEAVKYSEEKEIPFELVDRDINETLNDLRASMSLWQKSTIIASFIAYGEAEEEEDIEELKQKDMIEALIDDLGEEYPEIKEILLDKRNSYMAEKILDADFDKGLAVVGAAHVEGMAAELEQTTQRSFKVTEPFPWGKVVMYGIPLVVLSLFTYGFLQGGISRLFQLGTPWILLNTTLSLAGALIARAHLTTGIISGLAAPLTSVNPTIGSGMVAAYAEAYMYPPTVEDMESVVDITEYKDLWDNQAGRVILTFIFVTLGSFVATVLGTGAVAYLFAFF